MKHVYVIFNDCPADWDTPSILGVYAKKKDADRECLIIKGRDSVAQQYVIVKKWRVK